MMSHTRNLKLTILLLLTITALALSAIYLHTPQTQGAGPDLNGYTAQYECRAGNPNCNVDVVGLTREACQVTVTTNDTNWNKITGDTTKTVYCIEAGDHTAKGTLTLSFSGTANARKILRYTRANDNDDEPWRQTVGNQAKVLNLSIENDYWIVHRLTIDRGGGTGTAVPVQGSNVILNRMLIQNGGSTLVSFRLTDDQYRTIQNSVIRQTKWIPGSDNHCMLAGGSSLHTRVVNNEIYDCASDGLQTSRNSSPRDLIIENNDIYQTNAMYCDADGTPNPNGLYSAGENALDIKEAGNDPANPLRVIHNRFWGFRPTKTACGSTGSGGEAVIFHSDNTEVPTAINSHGLIQNNIMLNGTQGVASPNPTPTYFSVIGNLIYDMTHSSSGTSYAINESKAANIEMYLNTIINSSNGIYAGGGTSNDARCNVLIASGGSSGTSSQFDYNTYYSTTNVGETHNIDKTLTTRSNSTPYSVNQIIRLSGNPTTSCTGATDPDCFLYKVTQVGTSASSQPSYCSTANCITTDGGMKVQAIRGPYTFYRKLKTSPELFTIPYATPYSSAPERGFCPTSTGTRSGVGISDSPIF